MGEWWEADAWRTKTTDAASGSGGDEMGGSDIIDYVKARQVASLLLHKIALFVQKVSTT